MAQQHQHKECLTSCLTSRAVLGLQELDHILGVVLITLACYVESRLLVEIDCCQISTVVKQEPSVCVCVSMK